MQANEQHIVPFTNETKMHSSTNNKPFILNNNEGQKIEAVHVEEVLNLAEKEKEYIVRALRKHRSRRRDAASELGISERTLYRKIKEYDIED